MWGIGCVVGLTSGRFGLDPQLDRVADHAGPGVDSEGLAAERGRRGKPNCAPEWRQRMPPGGIELHVQYDRLRHPVQGEHAVDGGTIRRQRFDPDRDEFCGRVVFGIEQVAGQDCLVPGGIAQIHARDRHARPQCGSGPVFGVEVQAARAAGNRADGFRETGMIDREHHPRMHRVEAVVVGVRSEDAAARQE